jgi:site-specific DNA-cytosine methylase
VRPTALDLCAGAGGLSLGLQAAGYDVLGVELDPVAAEWHRAHVGPCVTESIATFHPSGPVDERGQLFRHLVRVAVEADARAVVLENVVGLLTWGRGAALRCITEAFEAAGYRTTWTVLDAADFGVPQHRRRLFVVGLREGRIQWPQPTHGPTLTARRPWVSAREALGLGGGVLADALAVAGLADRPSTTIQAHGSGRVAPAGHHARQWNGAVRLTAAQCAALQGFPSWDWSGLTKGDAHRLIGNGVPPALGEAVGRAVRLATEIEVAA